MNIDAPGSYRYPVQNLVSLRATKTLFSAGRSRVLLNVALINVLQNEGVQGLVTRNFFSSNFCAALRVDRASSALLPGDGSIDPPLQEIGLWEATATGRPHSENVHYLMGIDVEQEEL